MLYKTNVYIDGYFLSKTFKETGINPANVLDYVRKEISVKEQIPLIDIQIDKIFVAQGFVQEHSKNFFEFQYALQGILNFDIYSEIDVKYVPNKEVAIGSGESGVDSAFVRQITIDCLSQFKPDIVVVICGDRDNALVRNSISNGTIPYLVRLNVKKSNRLVSSVLSKKFGSNIVNISDDNCSPELLKALFSPDEKCGVVTRVAGSCGNIDLHGLSIYFPISEVSGSLKQGSKVGFKLVYELKKGTSEMQWKAVKIRVL